MLSWRSADMALWVGIALASALLFGASTPLSKLLLDHVSPFQLAGLLYLGAAAGTAPFAVRRRLVQRVRGLDSGNARRLLGAVLLGGIAGPVLLLFGLRVAAAASVSLWLNLELVATAVLGVLLFRDQLSGRAWLGAGLVVTSAVLLSWDGGAAGFLPGMLVALACVCWGFDNHFTSLIDGLTPQETTFWKGAAAGDYEPRDRSGHRAVERDAAHGGRRGAARYRRLRGEHRAVHRRRPEHRRHARTTGVLRCAVLRRADRPDRAGRTDERHADRGGRGAPGGTRRAAPRGGTRTGTTTRPPSTSTGTATPTATTGTPTRGALSGWAMCIATPTTSWSTRTRTYPTSTTATITTERPAKRTSACWTVPCRSVQSSSADSRTVRFRSSDSHMPAFSRALRKGPTDAIMFFRLAEANRPTVPMTGRPHSSA